MPRQIAAKEHSAAQPRPKRMMVDGNAGSVWGMMVRGMGRENAL